MVTSPLRSLVLYNGSNRNGYLPVTVTCSIQWIQPQWLPPRYGHLFYTMDPTAMVTSPLRSLVLYNGSCRNGYLPLKVTCSIQWIEPQWLPPHEGQLFYTMDPTAMVTSPLRSLVLYNGSNRNGYLSIKITCSIQWIQPQWLPPHEGHLFYTMDPTAMVTSL